MKHRKHRWLAGTLAFLFILFCTYSVWECCICGIKRQNSRIRDKCNKRGKKGDEGEEQITAETLTIEQGETFEIEKDFTGLSLKKGEKAVLKDVVSEDGQGFFRIVRALI